MEFAEEEKARCTEARTLQKRQCVNIILAQLRAFVPGVIYLFVPPAAAPVQNTRRTQYVKTNIPRRGVGKWFV